MRIDELSSYGRGTSLNDTLPSVMNVAVFCGCVGGDNVNTTLIILDSQQSLQ